MAPYEETKGVPKLSVNNYSEWARRMRAVFRAKKLWKFLYLYDPANTTTTPATTRRTTRSTENQAPEDFTGPVTQAIHTSPLLPTPNYDENTDIAELIDATLTVETRQGIGRTTLDDGVKLWNLLESKYSESGLRYYIKLARQLNNLQWPASENGDEYVGKRRQIQEEMAYTGIIPTPDLHDIVDLMEKLPPVRYSTILAILNAQDPATLTYELAIKLVTDEEKRWRLEAERSSDPENLALYANPNQSRNQNQGNSHTENERLQKCEHCGRKNHTIARCWKKYPEQLPKKFRKFNHTQAHSQAQDQAPENMAFTYTSQNTYLTHEIGAQVETPPRTQDSWIIDTGASNHLTFQRELLYNYKEFPTPQKCGGISSSFHILGMGSIDLQLIGGSTTRNITLQNVHYSPQAQANLLLVAQLTEVEFSFSKGFATGLFRNKEVFTGLYSRGAYRLKIEKGVCGKAYFSGPTTPASQDSLHL